MSAKTNIPFSDIIRSSTRTLSHVCGSTTLEHCAESAVGQTKGTILQNLDQPVIIKARDAGVELNLVFP